MKLLLIENNAKLTESLRHLLAADYSMTDAPNGKEGLRLARATRFDAIILGLSLPDMTGPEICRKLRSSNVDVPILVLSRSKNSANKIALFKAGADDCVTKPFVVGELRARLFALLKRSNFNKGNYGTLKVGDLVLDPLSRRVKRGGKTISLRRKEFDILEYLMRNQGKIVTRSMIMDNVWESSSSSWDSTINVHIKRVRDKIDRPYERKLIKTAYGLGYTIDNRLK